MPQPDHSQLTDRQAEILDYIRNYTAEHGYSPSTRDIGAGCGITSPNGVMCHVKSLIRKGALERVKVHGRALGRSYKVVDPDRTERIVEALAEKYGKRGRFLPAGVDVTEFVKFVLAFRK